GGLPLEVFSARFGLARVAMRRRDWTTAEREFVAAERVALTSGLSGYVSQLDYERGLLALRQGDFGAAERRFRSALALKSGANQLDRYAARSRLAYLYVLRNDLDAAERELRVATRELDSLRATLGERGRRVQAFQVRKGYDEADAGFATIVSGLAAGNRVPIARDLAERRRARELLGDLTRLGAATDSSFVDPSLHAHIASDERTALLEYVTGNDQPTTLFVSVGDSTTAYRLPSIDSLAADVASFSELLEAGAGAQALARSLGERVLGPVLRSLPSTITRLVVVPDGILHRIPFDALLTPNGQAVVERFTVSVVPSAGVLAKLQLLRDDARRSRVLALGDPQFEHERPVARGSVTETYREAFAGSGGLVRLPASAREARLAARFGARSLVRLRSRASEAFLKQAADSFDIIHFATHALVDDRSPSRTALALAPGAGDDGFAGAQELAALKLNAQLVVLSACRTARGALVAGEGVQGLTAPILQAGARAIVASQWRVEDRRTVPFIEDFYRALAAGQNVGDALREAKLSAMRRGEAPGVWAAFTLVGNPLVTVSLRSPRSVPFPVILLVSLGLVAGYGVWMRKRRGVARTSEPSASRAATVQ
ncbi:MAG TPA: CHAT domain-containing protein, partial [Gemmatimonadaceae bacterium]|nr:CHAT domain-containing protein [Gemmatimonadaceae bacterium]